MADKIMLGGQEGIRAQEEYIEAQRKLLEALDTRKNRLFNPELLAMAQGFLAPTRTGGFGESLGMAAANLGKAEQQAALEQQELAKAKLGMAQSGLQLAQMKQRAKAFESLRGQPQQGGLPTSINAPAGPAAPSAPATPSAGALPVGAPSGGPAPLAQVSAVDTKQPVSAPLSGGIKVTGAQNRPNPAQILSLAELDPSISPLDALKLVQEMEDKNYQYNEKGAFNKSTGEFSPWPTSERAAYQYGGKTYDLPAGVVALLDSYDMSGDTVKRDELLKKFNISATGAPSARKSATETKAESESAIELARARVKSGEDERRAVMKSASTYPIQIAAVNALDKLAQAEDASKIFGVLERPGIIENSMKLIESGIGAGQFRLGIPAVRDVFKNVGESQATIDKARYAAGLIAELNVQARKIGRGEGEGTITDREQDLFAQTTITFEDNPATVRARAEMLRERANFQKAVAKKLSQDKNLTVEDFKLTDEYADLENKYIDTLSSLVDSFNQAKSGKRSTAKGAVSSGQSGKKAPIKVDPSQLTVEQNLE